MQLDDRPATHSDTAAYFGPGDAVYVWPDDLRTTTNVAPTGLPVIGRLHLATSFPESPELVTRRGHLDAYAVAHGGHGYVVGDGLEGGVAATPEDRARLGRLGPDGLPSGLRRCGTCNQAVGRALNERTDLVVSCRCACENDNRCARCGQPLAGHRLSAWQWDDATGQAWYLAAYAALAHRCPADWLRSIAPRTRATN